MKVTDLESWESKTLCTEWDFRVIKISEVDKCQ